MEVRTYKFGEKEIEINAEKSVFKPIFVYNDLLKKEVYFSSSLSDLLNLTGKLKPCNEGISFILQSGVVPPPKSIFKNLYVIGLGFRLKLSSLGGKINLNFINNFPFFFGNKVNNKDDFKLNKSLILEELNNEINRHTRKNKASFLFHSSGKDSNMIALALAEAGNKDVVFLSHKSKNGIDESLISKKISKKLGFKHHDLEEVSVLNNNFKKDIVKLFEGSTFPCSDHTSISYPIYSNQIAEIKTANLIDGLSNDVYLGHTPPKIEAFKMNFAQYSSFILKRFNSISRTHSFLYKLSRSVSNNVGFFGLSLKDSNFYEESVNVNSFWYEKDKLLKKIDFIDFRGLMRGAIIDEQTFLVKCRNFSDSFGSNFIFPWSSPDLVEYFENCPERLLFDRTKFKNN